MGLIRYVIQEKIVKTGAVCKHIVLKFGCNMTLFQRKIFHRKNVYSTCMNFTITQLSDKNHYQNPAYQWVGLLS